LTSPSSPTRPKGHAVQLGYHVPTAGRTRSIRRSSFPRTTWRFFLPLSIKFKAESGAAYQSVQQDPGNSNPVGEERDAGQAPGLYDFRNRFACFVSSSRHRDNSHRRTQRRAWRRHWRTHQYAGSPLEVQMVDAGRNRAAAGGCGGVLAAQSPGMAGAVHEAPVDITVRPVARAARPAGCSTDARGSGLPPRRVTRACLTS